MTLHFRVKDPNLLFSSFPKLPLVSMLYNLEEKQPAILMLPRLGCAGDGMLMAGISRAVWIRDTRIATSSWAR